MVDLNPESLARQLRSPHGSDAAAVGDFMSKGNRKLYELLFRQLSIEPFHRILEVGCGNAWYVDRFISGPNEVVYHGIDLSPEMVEAAHSRILETGLERSAWVENADILKVASRPDFDRVVGLNILYFFPDSRELVDQLMKHLVPEGQLILGFRTPSGMRALPFTHYGFKLLEVAEVEELFRQAGLIQISNTQEPEILNLPQGEFQLTNVLVMGRKPAWSAPDPAIDANTINR